MNDSEKEDQSSGVLSRHSTAQMIVLTFVCFQDGGLQRDFPDAFQHYDDLCRSLNSFKMHTRDSTVHTQVISRYI